MTSFSQRRWVNVTMALGIGAFLYVFDTLYAMSLRDAAYLNGWVLFAGMVFLTLFNARKKVPFVPLLSGAIWLQVHIYVGLLCVLLFFMHAGLKWPTGTFEIVLWLVSIAIFFTGIVGLVLSRRLPPRLRMGERILFERIPGFRAQLANEAESLAFSSLDQTGNTAVANFYWTVLAPYLRKPRNFLGHLLGSRKHARRMENQFRELQRYEDSEGRELLGKLLEIANAKNNLDHQYSLQLTLRLWLFFHLPLSYSVLIMSLTHLMLVYAFGSAAP